MWNGIDRSLRFLAATLFTAALVSLLFPFSVHAAEVFAEADRLQTVSGNVEKAAIDDRGNVIAVEIWAEEGEAYNYFLVDDNPKGNELIPLVGKKVRAQGKVEEDEDGNKIITVVSFVILN